jgi:hypothetical protein
VPTRLAPTNAGRRSEKLDEASARKRKESFEFAARVAGLNVNRFVLDRHCAKAVEQRVCFSELVDAGVPIPDAIQQARTMKFVPRGKPGSIAATLDEQQRYEDAKWKWFGREDEITNALLHRRNRSYDPTLSRPYVQN